jgi:hypothetical protein
MLTAAGRVTNGCRRFRATARDSVVCVENDGGFTMAIDLALAATEPVENPYGCDPAEGRFHLPSGAFTTSEPFACVGYKCDQMIRVDAVDQDAHADFWVQITLP